MEKLEEYIGEIKNKVPGEKLIENIKSEKDYEIFL